MPEPYRLIKMRLTPGICEWLNGKAAMGYKKRTILRLILTEQMSVERKQEEAPNGKVVP